MNGKCKAHFLTKKSPRKFHWTVFYRRLHKKGAAEEVAKKRTRKTTKFQRAIVGASWEQIVAKRDQPSAVRKATRDAAAEGAKTKKKAEEAKKKTEKIKVDNAYDFVAYFSPLYGIRLLLPVNAPNPSLRLPSPLLAPRLAPLAVKFVSHASAA